MLEGRGYVCAILFVYYLMQSLTQLNIMHLPVCRSQFEKQKPQPESVPISGVTSLLSWLSLPGCLPKSGPEMDGHPHNTQVWVVWVSKADKVIMR